MFPVPPTPPFAPNFTIVDADSSDVLAVNSTGGVSFNTTDGLVDGTDYELVADYTGTRAGADDLQGRVTVVLQVKGPRITYAFTSEILPAAAAVVTGAGSEDAPYRVELSDIAAGADLLMIGEVNSLGVRTAGSYSAATGSASELDVGAGGGVSFNNTFVASGVGVYTLLFDLTDGSQSTLYVEVVDTSRLIQATRLHSLDSFTGANAVLIAELTAFISDDEADVIVPATGNEAIFSVVTVSGVSRLLLTDDGRAELNAPFAFSVALSVQATGDGPAGANKSTTLTLTVEGIDLDYTPVHALTLDAPTLPLEPVSARQLGVVHINGVGDDYEAALPPDSPDGFDWVDVGSSATADRTYELRYTGALFAGADATALLRDIAVTLSVGTDDDVGGFHFTPNLARSACYLTVPIAASDSAVADLSGTLYWHRDGNYVQLTGFSSDGFPMNAAGDEAANGDVISAGVAGQLYRLYQNVGDNTVRVKQLEEISCSSATGAGADFIYLQADGAPTVDPMASRLTYPAPVTGALTAVVRIADGAHGAAAVGGGVQDNPYIVFGGFSGVLATVAAFGGAVNDGVAFSATNAEGYFSMDETTGVLRFQIPSASPLAASTNVLVTISVTDDNSPPTTFAMTAYVLLNVLNVLGVPTNVTIAPGDFNVAIATLSAPVGDTHVYTLPDAATTQFSVGDESGVVRLLTPLSAGDAADGLTVFVSGAVGGGNRTQVGTRIAYEVAACTPELARPVFRRIRGGTHDGGFFKSRDDFRGQVARFHVLTPGAFAPADSAQLGDVVALFGRDTVRPFGPPDDAEILRVYAGGDGIWSAARRVRSDGGIPRVRDYGNTPSEQRCNPVLTGNDLNDEFFLDADFQETRQRQDAQTDAQLRPPALLAATQSDFDSANDGASDETPYTILFNTFTNESVLVQLSARGVAPYTYSTQSEDFAVDADGGVRFRAADRLPTAAALLSVTITIEDGAGDSVARVIYLSFDDSLFLRHETLLPAVGDGSADNLYLFAAGAFTGTPPPLFRVFLTGGGTASPPTLGDIVVLGDGFTVDASGNIGLASGFTPESSNVYTLTVYVTDSARRTHRTVVHLVFGAEVGGDYTANAVITLTGESPPSAATNLVLGTVHLALDNRRLSGGAGVGASAELSDSAPTGLSLVAVADARISMKCGTAARCFPTPITPYSCCKRLMFR